MVQNNMAPILEFKGDFHFLSNFEYAEFVWDNIVWPHSEAAYQAAKSLDRRVRLAFSVGTPATAKRDGKSIKIRPDWEQVKYNIMMEIVMCKFKQNPELRDLLLATGDGHLEEGNNHHDRIWGVCPPGSSNGRNWLGKILMEVRRVLQKEQDAPSHI